MLNPAPLESARFGLRIYRATPTRVDAGELLRELASEHVDIAIIRTPTSIPDGLHDLARRGVPLIHADTLVSYECPLTRYQPTALANPGLRIDAARAEDRGDILALTRSVFARYPNHYHANPLLAADAIVSGYAEWALSHLDAANKVAWVARVDGRVAAIACSTFDQAGACHGTLHGVDPEFAGNGIYTDLIRHTQHHFRKLGCHTLKIQTQAGNLPVQRVWVREGFVLSEVFDTFHVNALLDTARDPAAAPHTAPNDATTIARARAMRLFAATLGDVGRHQEITGPASGYCKIALWSQPESLERCEVRIRNYALASGQNITSATLHAADGKILALAQFDLHDDVNHDRPGA